MAGVGFYATGAFFSDTETSTGNTFQAGAIDLKIDNECHYNGQVCKLIPDTDTYVWYTAEGQPTDEPCSCTWTLKDLNGEAIFNFTDIKPGDDGEDTISIHVDSNPAWVCAELYNIASLDNSCNEPETDAEPACDPVGEGELLANLFFDVWMDNGAENHQCNNIKDNDETYLIQGATAQNLVWPIADSQHGSPITDSCVGVAWNVPSDVGNEVQTDSVTGDIKFSAVQARHNDEYLCTPNGGGDICNEQIDLMLVMDNSGSIDDAEETLMQAGAVSFITALDISPAQSHAGLVSFATSASLDQVLTGVEADVINAINDPFSGGSTNLEAGILAASAELAGGNDRPDGTVPDVMVIITDGNPNLPTNVATAEANALAAANAARAAGTAVYVVGVGGDVDAAFLQTIADQNKYYSAVNFALLEQALLDIVSCEVN